MKLSVKILIIFLTVAAIFGVSAYAATREKPSVEKTYDENLPTLIDLGAEWCPPCRQLRPVLVKLQERYGEKINFRFYDVDAPENAEIVGKYGARVLPTLVYLDKEGNVLQKTEGARTELQLETEFARLGWTS